MPPRYFVKCWTHWLCFLTFCQLPRYGIGIDKAHKKMQHDSFVKKSGCVFSVFK